MRPRHGAPICQIASSDYLDKDVYLNIRVFYRSAGYRIIAPGIHWHGPVDLLVVLRGDNGSDFQDFEGAIHIYDYVKEYQVDWQRRYPHAASLHLVTLAVSSPGSSETPEACCSRIKPVDAYLPVIPALWSCAWRRKRSRPVHVSNFKRMGGDAYQQDLLTLIGSAQVKAYGGNWHLAGVRAHPLSYRQANRVLAASARCFGLMWPYQRGRTLSGRMWQAPLNGCFVLSESGTNILGCPGVLERQVFDASAAELDCSESACRALASEASRFWEAHTRSLASALGLDPGLCLTGPILWPERFRLFLWDLEFRSERILNQSAGWLGAILRPVRRGMGSLARRLGVHPRHWAERRGRS